MSTGGPVDPVAVLVIRAWMEHGAAPGLRVRLTSTADVSRGDGESVEYADSVAGVLDCTRAWLEAFVQQLG